MRRYAMPREFYIPTGARKVSSKSCAAVAYLYESKGQPYAVSFYGKASKPVWHHRFLTVEAREKRITSLFAHYTTHEAAKAERKAAIKAKGRGLAVGDVLCSSWGYDQTNIDYYQVTALVGASMVEIRPIAQEREDTDYMTGRCVPAVDRFTGPAQRVRATDGRVKVGHQSA